MIVGGLGCGVNCECHERLLDRPLDRVKQEWLCSMSKWFRFHLARGPFATHGPSPHDGAQCDRPPPAEYVTGACLPTAMLLAIVLGACKKSAGPCAARARSLGRDGSSSLRLQFQGGQGIRRFSSVKARLIIIVLAVMAGSLAGAD